MTHSSLQTQILGIAMESAYRKLNSRIRYLKKEFLLLYLHKRKGEFTYVEILKWELPKTEEYFNFKKSVARNFLKTCHVIAWQVFWKFRTTDLFQLPSYKKCTLFSGDWLQLFNSAYSLCFNENDLIHKKEKKNLFDKLDQEAKDGLVSITMVKRKPQSVSHYIHMNKNYDQICTI